MTAALETQDLVVGYRQRGVARPVLESVTLALGPGELVSVLGINGAGKSTLLRTLARSQPALSGTVRIGGVDLGGMSGHDLARHVGVLLTERIAVGTIPAIRLVELGRYPHTGWAGRLSSSDHAVVAQAIIAVGAQHLAGRDFNELSDGERQRIMIARALAQQPALLILDEPAAFLDVSARVEMFVMLRRLAREKGIGIILSSHDLDLSLRFSDTIWLIGKDRRLIVGAPEDLIGDGSLSAAFSSGAVAFSAEDRAFRFQTQPRLDISVSAPDFQRALLQSLLEREGYAVADSATTTSSHLTYTEKGWTLEVAGHRLRAITYADLAQALRSLEKIGQP